MHFPSRAGIFHLLIAALVISTVSHAADNAATQRMGELKIKELRQRAEKELGPRFDIRAFHDALLLEGPLPPTVLEKQVNAWIAAQKTGNVGAGALTHSAEHSSALAHRRTRFLCPKPQPC